jgi:hypothetical protein
LPYIYYCNSANIFEYAIVLDVRIKHVIVKAVQVLSRKKRLLMIVLAGVLILGLGIFGIKKLLEDPGPEPFLTISVNHPGETPIGLGSKKFEPNQPRRILLPTIEVEGFVQRVGLDQNGQLTNHSVNSK